MKNSFNKKDVTFLLKDLTNYYKNSDIAYSIEDKEKNIQRGIKHYSEMINFEEKPSEQYEKIFLDLIEKKEIMSQFSIDIIKLAKFIVNQHKINNKKNIILISLVRAGTPIGILLKRAIELLNNNNIEHYSISIIRDKGLDHNALKYIVKNNPINQSSLFFIDGWTGKGVISNELHNSISEFNEKYKTNINSKLHVISDIAGASFFSSTEEDYIVPSAILNSTVSGLVSRSILNDLINENDFHGAIYYKHLENYDRSNIFIEKVTTYIKENINKNITAINYNKKYPLTEKQKYLKEEMRKNNYSSINFIKPGVNEATRVMLRRLPEKLVIKNKNDVNVQHLIKLANEKNIKIEINNDLPYNAVAFIKKTSIND